MDRLTIEHWRDGEVIKKIALSRLNVQRENGIARVVFPPGTITLATNDELRFDPQGIAEFLKGVGDGK
jgi:hypothetical protein